MQRSGYYNKLHHYTYGYGYTRGSGRVIIIIIIIIIIISFGYGYGYGSGSRYARPTDPEVAWVGLLVQCMFTIRLSASVSFLLSSVTLFPIKYLSTTFWRSLSRRVFSVYEERVSRVCAVLLHVDEWAVNVRITALLFVPVWPALLADSSYLGIQSLLSCCFVTSHQVCVCDTGRRVVAVVIELLW